jgi:hypothetical protein
MKNRTATARFLDLVPMHSECGEYAICHIKDEQDRGTRYKACDEHFNHSKLSLSETSRFEGILFFHLLLLF